MQAIISVANQDGLSDLARQLQEYDVSLFVTEPAFSTLRKEDISVHSLTELLQISDDTTKVIQLSDPHILEAVQAPRDPTPRRHPHQRHSMSIDIVVVNFSSLLSGGQEQMYPQTEILGRIDIGRLTLLQAAARNYHNVVILSDPDDYANVMQEWKEQGEISQETRRRLAVKAWRYLASFATSAAEYLSNGDSERFPSKMTMALERAFPLRYGENPHQQASLYRWSPLTRYGQTNWLGVANAEILQGRKLSYNNLLDLDAALMVVGHFSAPTVVIIRHTNPCGLACDEELVEAYRKAHSADPVAATSGVIGSNRPIDEATAHEICQLFFDAIIAPDYHPAALRILSKKKDLQLLATRQPIVTQASKVRHLWRGQPEIRSISGGLLLQTPDIQVGNEIEYRVVSDREPTLEETTDLMFAWKAVRFVSSNAVVLARRLMIVGVGAGQTNHVAGTQLALTRAGDRTRGAVLAADDIFPFADSIELAARAGVTAIIQPGGSVRDEEIIDAANQYAIAMIFTGKRHFRH